MSYEDLVEAPLWGRYSKKMGEKILFARNCGYFTQAEAQARGMRSIEGMAGSLSEGNAVGLYWLVDEADGIIVDAKFQVFGHSALIAAAEGACELVIGKNYDQAKRIGTDLIDKGLRDKPDSIAFPEECSHYLNLVLMAIEDGVEKCLDIPLAEKFISPVPRDLENEGEGYPGWLELAYEQKLAIIEQVLNEEVRPYIELDAGGIEVERLVQDKELIISYKGSCTSCFSAIGATLSTIQQIIQSKIHPQLIVVPNMETLHF